MKKFVERWLGTEDKAEELPDPAIPPGERVYCIGDVHGRHDLLVELHNMIANDAEQFEGSQTVIYLGDLIDRGLKSKQVVEELIASPLPGFRHIYLKGNHEQTLLDFLQHPHLAAGWLSWGGLETLLSYDVQIPPRMKKGDVSFVRDELESNLPQEHLDFLQSMELVHQAGDYVFVHAGIRPGIPLNDQRMEDLLWIRQDFTESYERHEGVVVHGHTIAEEVVMLPNRIGIDTGAFYTGVLTCLVLEGTGRRLLQTGDRG